MSVGPLPEDATSCLQGAADLRRRRGRPLDRRARRRRRGAGAPGARAEAGRRPRTSTAAVRRTTTTPPSRVRPPRVWRSHTTSQDDVDSANTLATVGIVVGVLGLLAAGFAIFRSRKAASIVREVAIAPRRSGRSHARTTDAAVTEALPRLGWRRHRPCPGSDGLVGCRWAPDSQAPPPHHQPRSRPRGRWRGRSAPVEPAGMSVGSTGFHSTHARSTPTPDRGGRGQGRGRPERPPAEERGRAAATRPTSGTATSSGSAPEPAGATEYCAHPTTSAPAAATTMAAAATSGGAGAPPAKTRRRRRAPARTTAAG